MSLPELTRNSFQCGISASKWLGLCKLLIAKTPTINSSDLIPSNLSNSVLVLYQSYPGDPDLQDYLKAAIQDGILPVSTFVATLLQAARSPSLHIPATLNTLCRIALDAHYSSGQPPIGSIVSFSESSIVTLGTVHDALALLRTAHTLSISHFHQLTTSASELVILLLSCVSDLSQLSTAQAMVYFNEVTFLLTHYRLSPEVRQVLDSFVISLTLLIGDDAKAAREAQMMQNLQFALGRGDISGPNSDGDMTTLGLMLNTMITYRAHEFGAGDITNAVALLVAGFRWSSWTPPVYYTQILLSAFNCLSQSASTTGAKIWKAFIVGRLPILLASFTDTVNADKSMTVDLRGAFQTGLAAAFRRPDLILQGDHMLSRETSNSPSNEDLSRSFSRELLQQLSKLNMVPQQVALQLDPLVFSESLPKWHGEANDMGLDLAAYLESKIMHDNNISDVQVWIDRIWKDVDSHSIFANIVLKRFSSPVTSLDVESLGHICKILYTYEHAMEIAALHVRITDLLFFSLQFLEEYDCETVGDPQTAFSHLGDVVLFVQYTLAKYKFENKDLVKNNRRVSPDFLINTDVVLSAQDRPQEDIVSFSAWFKALFDSNSEGIEDTILRLTKPKVLLRIAPTLFSSAIQATMIHKIDKDVLLNGVSYFTSPLLNWTLVGVIKSLAKDIQRVGFSAMTHLEILQSLVLSPSCPKPVLALCSPNIVSLLYEKKRQHPIPVSFNISAVRQVLADAIGMKGGGESLVMDLSAVGQQISYQQVQRAVQTTFMMARSHKPPYLDVRRCINIVPPIKFLQLFWTELVASANLGELEACRRIATFVLTMPQDSTVCPLLPVFMHIVLPSLVASASQQQPPEQAVTVELLVVTISSVLNAALHLEWAMRSVSGDDRLVLGQLSTTIARRLAQDLRRNRGRDVNTTILRRLASSQSFVANFPTFISELNP